MAIYLAIIVSKGNGKAKKKWLLERPFILQHICTIFGEKTKAAPKKGSFLWDIHLGGKRTSVFYTPPPLCNGH